MDFRIRLPRHHLSELMELSAVLHVACVRLAHSTCTEVFFQNHTQFGVASIGKPVLPNTAVLWCYTWLGVGDCFT